jgi:integrase
MVGFVVIAGHEGKAALKMPVRRDPKSGAWFFRTTVKTPDGKKLRLFGTPGVPGTYHDLAQSQRGATEAEQRAIKDAFTPKLALVEKKEVPTFSEWFKGRFWREWVIGRRNKPTEVKSKDYIYECHLKAAFGEKRLDEIGTGEIAKFRASLVEKKLSEKRINNILAVLSKALKYAVDCELIAKSPKIGLYKVERPEIEPWDFEQYARMLAAAKLEGSEWYVAASLAGEAGLRSGEVKALRWREDVDLIAKTITVNTQTCYGETTTPKGRTRRVVPMTVTLEKALRAMETIREGYVVRNLDGSQKTDGQANAVILRICRRAGLPVKRWHTLRHTFGTHAALFGVNPWRLQSWMGHKRIDETMIYVHVAEQHRREIPPEVLEAGNAERDPDRRVLAMLSARGKLTAKSVSERTASDSRGSQVAAEGA